LSTHFHLCLDKPPTTVNYTLSLHDALPIFRKLLDGKYLDRRARLIGERAMREAAPGDTEANGTTHFSIADAQGNVVAMSSTIENPFGSRIMVRGFLLNNQLTDFDFIPGSVNEVQPRKRPRSSMAPAMVFERGGRLRMALGSPGGHARRQAAHGARLPRRTVDHQLRREDPGR